MLKYMMYLVVANGRTAEHDILADERFAGNINQITWLTDILDGAFIQFITVIAFFIISAALLRNVIAGAYAAYPKFFDRINQAKQARADRLQAASGDGTMFWGNKAGMKARFQFSGSSWGWEILSYLIPDFKSLSDFENDNVSPKQYWIVAIPQMFAIVMIGIMIYNGYYRDITNTVGKMGSRVITTVINNVHPVELVDSIFKGFWIPEGQSAVDNSDSGKIVNSLSKATMSRLRKVYTDIKDQGVLTEINSSVEGKLYYYTNTVNSNMPGAFESDKYKVATTTTVVLGKPKYVGNSGSAETLKGVDDPNFVKSISTDGSMVEFNYSFRLTNEIVTAAMSPVGADKEYYVWIRTIHTKKAEKVDTSKNAKREDLKLVIYDKSLTSINGIGMIRTGTIKGDKGSDIQLTKGTIPTSTMGDNVIYNLKGAEWEFTDEKKTIHKVKEVLTTKDSSKLTNSIKAELISDAWTITYDGQKWTFVDPDFDKDTTEPTSTDKPKPLN